MRASAGVSASFATLELDVAHQKDHRNQGQKDQGKIGRANV